MGPEQLQTSLHVLLYLAATYRRSPEAEVSGPELEHVLELQPAVVRQCVVELAGEGLVDWDPLLSNLWLRITEKGLAVAESLGT